MQDKIKVKRERSKVRPICKNDENWKKNIK